MLTVLKGQHPEIAISMEERTWVLRQRLEAGVWRRVDMEVPPGPIDAEVHDSQSMPQPDDIDGGDGSLRVSGWLRDLGRRRDMRLLEGGHSEPGIDGRSDGGSWRWGMRRSRRQSRGAVVMKGAKESRRRVGRGRRFFDWRGGQTRVWCSVMVRWESRSNLLVWVTLELLQICITHYSIVKWGLYFGGSLEDCLVLHPF